MDELLQALRDGNEAKINELACALLVTKSKEINRAQANEFENYAPCKIFPQHRDIFKFRCFVGIIRYNGRSYSFG